MANSTYNSKNGRYVLGGITERSSFAVEWWERKMILPDPTDLIYAVEKKYEGRPDLLGLLFYGDTALWWVVCQVNGILDPLQELVEGKILTIPLIERVKSQLFNNPSPQGGVPSTR